MVAALKKLITAESAEDGQPLFPNAAKLADAVIAAAPDTYTNPKTTAALLNFVFRCERKCSPELRDAILKAVRTRLAKQPQRVQDDWIQRIGRAADALSVEVADMQQSQSPPDEEQFGAMIAQAKVCKEQFIITPLTAEEDDEMRQASQLNQLLLELLGLCPPLSTTPQTTYCFLLPAESKAREFWKKLKDKTEAACTKIGADSANVAARLKTLDGADKLMVFVVPPYICGCPIVVFDPTSRFSTAFSFGYHAKNVIDAIQWDAAAIIEWKKNVFTPFQRVKTAQEAKSGDKDTLNFFYGYRYTYEQSQKD